MCTIGRGICYNPLFELLIGGQCPTDNLLNFRKFHKLHWVENLVKIGRQVNRKYDSAVDAVSLELKMNVFCHMPRLYYYTLLPIKI